MSAWSVESLNAAYSADVPAALPHCNRIPDECVIEMNTSVRSLKYLRTQISSDHFINFEARFRHKEVVFTQNRHHHRIPGEILHRYVSPKYFLRGFIFSELPRGRTRIYHVISRDLVFSITHLGLIFHSYHHKKFLLSTISRSKVTIVFVLPRLGGTFTIGALSVKKIIAIS